MNGTTRVSQCAVYLDPNVFIEMWENKGSPNSARIWDMLDRGMSANWQFVSSELSLAEILVKPIAHAKASGDWQLVETYRFQIYDKGSFQRIIPVSRAVLDMAANVRSENKIIKLPDAIHLATALIENCSVFISNDIRLVDMIRKALHPSPFEMALTFANLADLDHVS